MNILKPEKKVAVLSALVEGCSIRSVVRITGVHKTTILRLLVETGKQCQRLLEEKMRGLHCTAIECDEIWAFIGKKERHVTSEDRVNNPQYGDVYTFVALDPDTKLIPCFVSGKRDALTTWRFIRSIRERVAEIPQISTDAFRAYIEAVKGVFGKNAHYAQIAKFYSAAYAGAGRYSPPYVTGVRITEISGQPVREKVCTSYVERNNLTIRMQLRRFTRLTNAFSRKLENLEAALSLYFWHYNFCRIHSSLRITPAMAAGITDHIWEIADIIH